MNQLSEAVRELYDRDLAQRLRQCWDDLDQLDRMLQRIAQRAGSDYELCGDPVQAAQIEVIVQVIGRQVEDLILSRELNSRSAGTTLSEP